MPVDNITCVADVTGVRKSLTEENYLRIGKLTLIPIPCPKTGEIIKHQTIIKNLLFTFKENHLIVSNSLHKFFKGNNYSNFSYSELIKSIEKVEGLTGICSRQFEIKKMEFAVNITTEKPPHQYFPMFSDFKGREFDKMRSKAFWYGVKYHFTEYALKVYDKSEMVKRTERIAMNQNLLRFEIEYKKSRIIPHVKTLSDLKNREKIKGLFDELVKQVEQLNCEGSEDFSNINSRNREMYFAGQNSRFWKVEKGLNVNTAKSKKRKFREIQKRISPKNLISEFTDELEVTFNWLINT